MGAKDRRIKEGLPMAIKVNVAGLLDELEQRIRDKTKNPEYNLTNQAIAEATGLTPATISNWRRGKVDGTRFEVLNAWCQSLGVQPGVFIVYEDEGQPNGYLYERLLKMAKEQR